MDDQRYSYYQPQQPLESASGTTSPNNSNSGPTAYILTIICVLALVGLCMVSTRCVNKAIDRFLPQIIDETMERLENRFSSPESFERYITDTDDIDADNFEDYFERVFGETYEDYFDRNDSDTSADSYEFDSRDVLGLDLAIYDWDIDGMVSANAYAGADAAVKDYVRDFVLADRETTEDLIREFRRAGRDGEDFHEHLEEARGIAQTLIDDIRGIDIPDTDDGTEELLNEAIVHANARWNAIVELIETLRDNDTVKDQDLEILDDTVYYETRNAAQALEDALAASRN